MRKLICDCCGSEIDTTYMDSYDIHPKAKLRVFDELVRDVPGDLNVRIGDLEYDLCEDCTNRVVDFIKAKFRFEPTED